MQEAADRSFRADGRLRRPLRRSSADPGIPPRPRVDFHLSVAGAPRVHVSGAARRIVDYLAALGGQ